MDRTILVVDDNRDGADSLALYLENFFEAKVHTAYDGAEATRLVTENSYDMAFLDIGLPVVTGYQIARYMREKQGDRSLVLTAVTGYSDDEHKLKIKAAGFDHHFVKPLNFETLDRLVEKTFSVHG